MEQFKFDADKMLEPEEQEHHPECVEDCDCADLKSLDEVLLAERRLDREREEGWTNPTASN